jgi:hypothetical protein
MMMVLYEILYEKIFRFVLTQKIIMLTAAAWMMIEDEELPPKKY